MKIKKFTDFILENFENSDKPLLFVFDHNNKILAFNIPDDNKELLNKYLYDEHGKNVGGYGLQYLDDKQYIKFDSLEDIQKWNDEREIKYLNKKTQNKQYQDLSYIAYELRKLKSVNYQHINRGSCFKFAKIISKLGYDNFTFIFSNEEHEVVHVYIKLNNNLYFDAYGFHNKSDIKSEYEIGDENIMYDADIKELDHYCSIDTYSSLTTIPLSNEEWNVIKNIINKAKNIK